MTAKQTSKITKVNRNTINRYFNKFRSIVKLCQIDSPFQGEIEIDESYFGAKRVKGKRGRGTSGKTIVFGLLKRDGKVYTDIVPDVQKETLQAIIRGKISIESIIYSDKWRGYDGLVDVAITSILESIMGIMNLPKAGTISIEENFFGVMLLCLHSLWENETI